MAFTLIPLTVLQAPGITTLRGVQRTWTYVVRHKSHSSPPVYPSVERITLWVKHLPWLKIITACVQGSISILAEHLVKNRQKSGLFSLQAYCLKANKIYQQKQCREWNTLSQMQHYSWDCIHIAEAQLFNPALIFDAPISQQAAVQFNPADSEQFNNLTGPDYTQRDFATSVGQSLPFLLGTGQAAVNRHYRWKSAPC